MLLVTTAFAPITTLSAIVTPPIILAPEPIKTLLPIIGLSVEFIFPETPIVTSLKILQLLPILAYAFITTLPWTICSPGPATFGTRSIPHFCLRRPQRHA